MPRSCVRGAKQSSMESLMKNLLAKNPHYVRCIKPNDSKSAGVFQTDLCRHQVRYLGCGPHPHARQTACGAGVRTPFTPGA